MLLTPQKTSLVKQTKAVLLDGMKTARWQQVLPGERLLSRELRVSRWTLRAALVELGRVGYIKIAHGRPCAITAKALETRKRRPSALRIAILAPAPLSQLRFFVALWVDELRTILHEQGISLTVIDSVRAFHARPAHALQMIVETHPHDGWLLMLSTWAMQKWFEDHGLPALVTGSRFEGVQLPAMDVDFHAAGVHAAHTVFGAGHRRVALLVPHDRTAGVVAGEAGLREIADRRAPEQNSLVVATYGDTKLEVCRAVNRVLACRRRPTAVIVFKAIAALTVFSQLRQHGLRIPQDISLVAMEWEPFLSYVVPEIAHYELSPTQFAQRTARSLLRRIEVQNSNEAVLIQPTYVGGSSLGPPPASGEAPSPISNRPNPAAIPS